MKKILIIILTFCSSISAYTQCYYHEVFPSKTRVENEFGYVITSLNNKIFSVGVSLFLGNNSLFYLNKHDSCGDTLLQKLYDLYPVGIEVVEDIIILSNGNILLQGITFDTVEQARDNFILEIDTQGQVINYKIIDVGYNDYGNSIAVNNNKLTIGGTYWSDGGLFLVHTDSVGNILWQQDYEMQRQNRLQSIALARDSGYVLGGFMYKANFETDYFMIKTDKNGNEEWSKLYGKVNYEEVWGYVISTLDGGYLQVGYQVPYPGPSYQDSLNPYVIKTDSVGNIEWEKKYINGFNSPTVIDMVIQTPDSAYLFCGTDQDSIENVPLLLLYKTDSQGNLLWKRTYTYYGGNTDNYNTDFTISENGDIAITGYIISAGPNDMFVLKVDSCGYLNNANINAAFTYNYTSANEIALNNESTEYCTALWYFGDGDSSYTQSPAHIYNNTGTYTVTLIVRAGNDVDTFTQQVNILTVGVESPQSTVGSPRLRVYPNPASQEINLQLVNVQSSIKIKEVKVYDVAGKIIPLQLPLGKGESGFSLNINGFANGLYFLEVQLSNGSVERVKFVKQ